MGATGFPNVLTKMVGKRNVRQSKTTQAQRGKSFTKLRLEQAELFLKDEVEKKFGALIESDEERPWPGAFAIVSEELVAAWLRLLETNGLRRFSDSLNVDWFTRPETLPKKDPQQILIMPTPIASEPVIGDPRNAWDMVPLDYRIAIMDPQFLDENGRPLYKEIPQDYVEGVMNTLNPAAVYCACKQHLPEMLKRAGKYASSFERLLEVMKDRWAEKKPPTDLNALREYVGLGFLHEAVHALTLHLPDVLPDDLPAAERRDLEAISMDKYMEILKQPELIGSVVYVKNVFKALEAFQDEAPSRETQTAISTMIALEMLCDRFSMYLYENHLKIQLYNQALSSKIGYPIIVNIAMVLEAARREGQLTTRSEVQGLSGDELAKLEAELQAAERDHIYISGFGDPVISLRERVFYIEFHNLLRHFDDKNQIMRFTRQHALTSHFMKLTSSGKAQEFAMGLVGFVCGGQICC